MKHPEVFCVGSQGFGACKKTICNQFQYVMPRSPTFHVKALHIVALFDTIYAPAKPSLHKGPCTIRWYIISIPPFYGRKSITDQISWV